MKSVFISFNQALTEDIISIMDHLHIEGYTLWEVVQGRGSNSGEPHLGSHAWPTLNSSMLTVIEDDKVDPFLDLLKRLDLKSEMQGLRAFVIPVERSI